MGNERSYWNRPDFSWYIDLVCLHRPEGRNSHRTDSGTYRVSREDPDPENRLLLPDASREIQAASSQRVFFTP